MSVDGKGKPAVGVNRNQDTNPNSSQVDQDRGGNVPISPLTSSNFNERIYENVKFHQKRNRKKSKPHSRHDTLEQTKPPDIPLCTPEICIENIDELQVEELPNQPIEIVTIEELQDEAAVCTVTAYVTPSPQYCTRECLSLSREKLLNLKEGDRHLKSKIPVKRTQKKLKRIAVEDYFFPMLRSPVYLDVINEETSSLSNEEDDTLTLTQPCTSYESTTLPVPWKTRQEQEYEEQLEREREEDEETEEVVKEENIIEICETISENNLDTASEDEEGEVNRINNDLTYPTTLAILTENKIELVPITKGDVPEEIDANETTEPVTVPTDALNLKDRQSRSPSFGSCCSSRSSSIVTAINVGNYNPHSSVGNMEQFLAGLDRPGTLRELCLNRLLSLPFGKEVLQELAEVSQNLQGLTEKLSEYAQQYQPLNSKEQPVNNNNNNNNYLEESKQNQSPDCSEDRTCSSKSEQEYDEWIKSFIRHHKNIIDSKVSSVVEEVKFSNASVSSDYKDLDKNRLLDIILAESDCQAMNDSKETKDVSTGDLLTNITSEITKNTNTVISTSSEDTTHISLVNLNNSPKKELKESDSVTRNNLYNPTDDHKFSAQSGNNIELEMTYLLIKEKQIQKELEKLEEEKRKIYAELSSDECSCSMNINKTPETDKLSKEPQRQAMTEFFRQKMFDEYMNKIAERESRLQHKIIKVSSGSNFLDAALNEEGKIDVVHVKKLEEEFLERVKEKRKHGKLIDDEEENRDSSGLVSDADVSENDEEAPVLVLDGLSVEHGSSLPSHLKEFLALTKNAPCTAGVWSPTQTQDNIRKGVPRLPSQGCPRTEPPPSPPPPPIWTPQSSPVLERKFRPISFSSPKSERRHTFNKSDEKPDTNKERITITPVETVFAKSNSDSNIRALTAKFDSNYTPRLPKVQNPTVVLLRTARENQLSKNARENAAKPPPAQLNLPNTAPPPPPPLFNGIAKEPPPSPSKQEPALRISPFFPREFNGIGPTTKDGMPLVLRSEIKNEDQSRWYKKMYDTIHKPRKISDEYVTIRYKQRRPQYPYISGYLSEPGSLSYDSDMDERVQWPPGPKQPPQVIRSTTTGKTAPATLPRTLPPSKPWSSYSDIVEPTHKNQPKSIANYHPGKSSITGKETEEQLEKDRTNNHVRTKPNHTLKESGYNSDSTLVFHRKEEPPRLAPAEQKEAYITIQKGGDVPFSGLRKPAPEKPTNLLDIEYFLSPIHMKAPSHTDIVCYPVTIEHNSRPPSPPKRKSSHNNKTLRLISLMKLRGSKASNKRHEVCFKNTTNVDQDNKVKYLKDKITYKLYPQKKKSSERVVPCTRVKSSIVAPKTTNLSRSKESGSACKEGKSNPGPGIRGVKKEASPAKKLLLKTKEKKGDVEKKKVLGSKQPKTITFSNLKSKKVEEFSDDNNGLLQKKSLTTFSSVKNGAKNVSETALPITVKISQNGQKILKTSFNSRKVPEVSIVKTRSSPKSTHSSTDDRTSRRIKIFQNQPKIMDSQPIMDMEKNSDLHEIKFNEQFLEDIQKQREKIQSNYFYQHLLLQNYPSSYPLLTKNYFLDTQIFKRSSLSEPTVGAMKVYLEHTRPVSDSRFRTLDLRSRSSSPKSVRFVSRETHARSSSLPGTMYFSQTTRPVSPMVPRRPLPLSYRPDSPISSPNISPVAKRKSRITETSPPKIIFTETSRPVSPCITKAFKPRARSAGASGEEYPNVKEIKRDSKLFFSETNRPVSPLSVYRPMRLEVLNKDLPKMIFSETRRPVSPSASPRLSRRSRGDDEKGGIGFVRYVPSKLSLLETGSTRRSKSNEEKFVSKPSDGIDGNYRKAATKLIFTETTRPVSPIISSHKRRSRSNEDAKTAPKSNPLCFHVRGFDKTCRYCQSTKFRDLTDFYSDIERVARLEKSTSTSDLKLRKRTEEEIIDFDRWKEVRTRERAEKELDNLYSHLRDKERDLGFLFRCKQKDTKWKKEYDRGLRIKEKSVDDIKDEFERLKINLRQKNDYEQRDTYKPLWRGNSVTNIVSTISERRSRSEGRTTSTSKAFRDSEKMLTHGIGSRIWSSLSMEQVNLLKEQLQEIYDHKYKKQEAVSLTFPITRSHSQKNDMFSPCNSDINEVDKRRLSQDISREVLTKFKTGKDKNNENLKIKDKIMNNNNNNTKTITTKETKKVETTSSASVTTENKNKTSNQTITPLIKTTALTPPIFLTSSENESEKTDDSTHTVVPKSNKIIEEKVEYFEKLSIERPYTPTIYKPADDPEVEDVPKKNKLGNSSSYQDLKELFGEQESPKFSSPIPFQVPVSNNYCSSPVLHSMDGSISEVASTDSLGRSQSLSPYLEKPITDSCRLSEDEKFTSFETHRLHHSKSDSCLNKHSDIFFTDGSLVSVDFLKRKFENLIRYGRSRYRKGGVVSPLFLRAKDRLMPHINIISKIARLYTRNYSHNKRATLSPALEFGIPVGEVEKLKEKFDGNKDISLLGEMYTSSPDLKELRRISPYLSAGWIAHRYPRLEDNTRSLSCPEKQTTDEIRPPKKMAPKRILRTSQNSRLHHHGCPAKEKYRKTDVNGKTKKFDGDLKGQPRQYVERDVTIHYRTPVRQEVKEMVGEEELAHRQAEAMRRLYQEESQRKRLQVSNSLQELKDMHSRRHTDNFMPSQKSPIPLDRYEHLPDFPVARVPSRGPPEPRLIARALYNFVGQTSRELTFRKGDLIRLRRQVDNNWYEGEYNAMSGLFPVNYVEILPYTEVKSSPSKKTFEGQARAKYNFTAQTQLELSLSKGELVTITRRVDNNWFEGKIGGRKGIFPVSYVEVLTDPGSPTIPNLCLPPVSIPAKVPVSKNARPERVADGSLDNGIKFAERRPLNQALHIETQSEPTPYKALFKYLPQNEDELELIEGDIVYVLEKCDDGWYVGSSERTGAFGTFPGNYVHKI